MRPLYAGSYLYERTVVCHNHHFAFHLVADLEFCAEGIPRMSGELFETEGDTFFGVVEVEDNDVEFFVQMYDLFRMVYTAPREVGDMYKAVYAAQVDEHAVRGDVLDGTFENLTFFEFRDDVFLLLFEFRLYERLMRHYHVAGTPG